MYIKRPHYIALISIFALALILFKSPSQSVAKVKLGIGALFLPLFGLSTSTSTTLEKTGNSVISRGDLVRQNEDFRRENQELKLKLRQSDEAWRENGQLRELLGWQKQTPWKLKLARVIGRDTANWWRTMQINLGARDGLRLHAPVLTMDGLVGRVAALGEMRSQVLLLGDPNLRVGALVEGETRETGVILSSTSRPLENNMVDLGFLSRNSSVKPGQPVVTSGDGGIFPKGILIGHIVDTRPVEYGLSTEARVKLAARFSSLEEVWVMLP